MIVVKSLCQCIDIYPMLSADSRFWLANNCEVSIDHIGPGNGFLPDGTKPLPEPMLTNDQWGVVAFTW